MYPKSNYFLISLILSITFFLSGCAVGILGGPTSYSDRRTTESQITDEKLEWQTVLKTQDIEGEFRANFVSYNQVVLITGQSPNQEIIDKISKEEECLALQHRKYLPEWIRVSDSIEVELFVWLDYSTIPKDWKCSRRLFLRKIREMTQPRRPPARLNELFTGLLMSPAMTSLFR